MAGELEEGHFRGRRLTPFPRHKQLAIFLPSVLPHSSIFSIPLPLLSSPCSSPSSSLDSFFLLFTLLLLLPLFPPIKKERMPSERLRVDKKRPIRRGEATVSCGLQLPDKHQLMSSQTWLLCSLKHTSSFQGCWPGVIDAGR